MNRLLLILLLPVLFILHGCAAIPMTIKKEVIDVENKDGNSVVNIYEPKD